MATFVPFIVTALLGGVGLATGQAFAYRLRSSAGGICVLVVAAAITYGIGSGLHAATGFLDPYWLQLSVFAGLATTACNVLTRQDRPYEGARG